MDLKKQRMKLTYFKINGKEFLSFFLAYTNNDPWTIIVGYTIYCNTKGLVEKNKKLLSYTTNTYTRAATKDPVLRLLR